MRRKGRGTAGHGELSRWDTRGEEDGSLDEPQTHNEERVSDHTLRTPTNSHVSRRRTQTHARSTPSAHPYSYSPRWAQRSRREDLQPCEERARKNARENWTRRKRFREKRSKLKEHAMQRLVVSIERTRSTTTRTGAMQHPYASCRQNSKPMPYS